MSWARHTVTNAPQRPLRADDIPLDLIEQIGRSVVIAVGEKRSTWRRANLYAETARQTLGWRFASDRDREASTGLIVDAAEQGSLRLTPARPRRNTRRLHPCRGQQRVPAEALHGLLR